MLLYTYFVKMKKILIISLVTICMTFSASAYANDPTNVKDCSEGFNRASFKFNQGLDKAILRPIAIGYRKLPNGIRAVTSNFLNNLSNLVTIPNNALQGDMGKAATNLARLGINSTVGILGMFDVAKGMGFEKYEKEDFGQTLGVMGSGPGCYIVLPIFGPSSPRDLVGKFIVDPYFDPFGRWTDNTNRDNISYSKQALSGVDEFSGVVDELRQIRKTSVDYYAAIRSLYRQKRRSEISNGQTLDLPPIPSLGYDLLPEDIEQPLAGGIR